MRTFRAHLKEKLKDEQFKELFNEERELLRIGLEIAEARQKSGITQGELAAKANVTQQQVSKIEHGVNCNILTLLKICRILKLRCMVNSAAT
jgi:HTH-type transcriptional regulator / antitoxin HipB